MKNRIVNLTKRDSNDKGCWRSIELKGRGGGKEYFSKTERSRNIHFPKPSGVEVKTKKKRPVKIILNI